MAITKMPELVLGGAGVQLILAGQVDDIVGEVELHSVQRGICERDFLGVNDVAIAIVAENGCAAVGANQQLPDMELFLGNA